MLEFLAGSASHCLEEREQVFLSAITLPVSINLFIQLRTTMEEILKLRNNLVNLFTKLIGNSPPFKAEWYKQVLGWLEDLLQVWLSVKARMAQILRIQVLIWSIMLMNRQCHLLNSITLRIKADSVKNSMVELACNTFISKKMVKLFTIAETTLIWHPTETIQTLQPPITNSGGLTINRGLI